MSRRYEASLLLSTCFKCGAQVDPVYSAMHTEQHEWIEGRLAALEAPTEKQRQVDALADLLFENAGGTGWGDMARALIDSGHVTID